MAREGDTGDGLMSATEATKKRGGRRLNAALSDRAVKAAKAPGRLFDGHGLFVLVTPAAGSFGSNASR